MSEIHGIDHFEVIASWKNDGENLIGCCDINKTRGKEVMSFMFDTEWIRRNPGLILDPALTMSTGRQYPKNRDFPFGFLSDIAPDRWGRKLMDRKELEDSKNEKRSKRTLMESDYILSVSDEGRTGGIRLRTKGLFCNSTSHEEIPPLTDLRNLEAASLALESHSTNVQKWIKQLIVPGSSLGGARPKANLRDTDGSIWIAKFPSKNDDIDVGAWEMTVHELGLRCGLNMPEAKTIRLSPYGTTFLTKRFDRVLRGSSLKRCHFASAMTMLERTDNDEEQASYLDLAGIIEKICGSSVRSDLKELWKRMVFNILTSNTDDHLRNHGFILNDKDEWELSPAYDVNPSTDKDAMSLNIDFNSNEKDAGLALSVCEMFRIDRETAENEIKTMSDTITHNWREIASKYGISKGEQDYMSNCFNRY